MTKRIVFIGAGNMASSLIGGLIANGTDKTALAASDPNQEQRTKLAKQFSITTYQDNRDAIAQADVVVLAVKPQLMEVVCREIASFGLALENKLFISIAAGISISRLKEFLGEVPVVRTMPNTPALVQTGMTGLYAPTSVTQDDRDFAQSVMAAVGKTLWVQSEQAINHVIAAAGSAPAYFFLFMEAMADYAQELGFTPEQARTLVEQSALGSAKMVAANPELPLATLRANVTSKGGTTAEAIRVFEEQGLRDCVKHAMQAASDRGAEMEQLF
jgi:pyrroline-5-carboxylate reductase